jgi:hypothetical protein
MQNIQEYLQFLSDNGTAPALKTQWTCHLSNVPSKIINNLNLEKYEHSPWSISNKNILNRILSEYVKNSQRHFMYISDISINGEESKTRPLSIIFERGAFHSPDFIDRRVFEGKHILKTKLYETEYSFLDFLIRPWTIIASYEGSIAQSGSEKIKANELEVIFYSRTGERRKRYIFSNIFPFSINSSDFQHSKDGNATIEVKWLFTHYRVEDIPNSFSTSTPTQQNGENGRKSSIMDLVSSITKPIKQVSGFVNNIF